MKNKLPIIPFSQPECQVKCWKTYLKQAVTDPLLLLDKLSLSIDDLDFSLDLDNAFVTRVPQPFIDKMKPGDASDPLFLQVISRQEENLTVVGYTKDPLLEQNGQLPGLLHKYQGRVLLILSSACAVNCRYCFRRHFPYEDNHARGSFLSRAVDYIRKDSSISEVILSGGDPLMLGDESLTELVNALENIPQLKRLRIHSRLPVVIPQRITAQLCELLASSRLSVSLVLHINHANEIDDLLADYLSQLHTAKVTLLNQSVLLRHINDNLNTLCELSEKLFSVGVVPYYLHLMDKIAGAAHFDISEDVAYQLIAEMRARLPGYLVPRLAREEANRKSKTIIA